MQQKEHAFFSLHIINLRRHNNKNIKIEQKINNMNYLQEQQRRQQPQQLQGHEGGFVKCIAIREFYGDPNLNQLCFEQNTPLEVDLSRPSENGWRLGRVGRVQGWIPEWASIPVSQHTNSCPPPSPKCPPPPVPPPSRSRNNLRRSRDFIIPLQSIGETYGNEAGFDQRNNDIMGGNVPRAKTADGSSTIPALDNHNNPFEEIPDAYNTNTSNNKKWNMGIRKLFQKQSDKLDTENESSSSAYNNPYTQKQKQVETDWTDAPQIVSDDGRIAVVETDGQTTEYRNENLYQISTKTNQFADQLSTTTSNLSHQLSNFKMPPMPKMGNNSSNKNDNDNNEQQQQQQRQPPQQSQQQKQVIEVTPATSTNNENEQPMKKTKHKFGMPSSLKMMPKINMPKMMSMPNSNKKQNHLTTKYCDRNGNEQTLVEETKRSNQKTSLDIYY